MKYELTTFKESDSKIPYISLKDRGYWDGALIQIRTHLNLLYFRPDKTKPSILPEEEPTPPNFKFFIHKDHDGTHSICFTDIWMETWWAFMINDNEFSRYGFSKVRAPKSLQLTKEGHIANEI